MLRHSTLVLLLCLVGVPVASAQVTEAQSISNEFLPFLGGNHRFGSAITSLGDLDGDGPAVNTLAVAASLGDAAVWILFMDSTDTVLDRYKIDANTPILKDRLEAGNSFGTSVANIGDLDGNMVNDLAVGDVSGRGAVWILFLTRKGRVQNVHKIDADSHPDLADLKDNDQFGQSITALGDLDGAANPETKTTLAVGAQIAGTVWVLSIDALGEVLSTRKINGERDDLREQIGTSDRFGGSMAAIDLTGDGVAEWLAVGAPRFNKLFVFEFDPEIPGEIAAFWRLDEDALLLGELSNDIFFGESVVSLGDFDADPGTVAALAVGAPSEAGQAGRMYVLFLEEQSKVKRVQKIGAALDLSANDFFGSSVASDTITQGAVNLYVGARGHDAGGTDAGAVWVLSLALMADTVSIEETHRLSRREGNVAPTVEEDDEFGRSVANLGDLDAGGPSVRALAVGAPGDDGTESAPLDNAGAVWVLFLDADTSVTDSQKISATEGGFTGSLSADDGFGTATASLSDIDDDGAADLLAVGAPGDDDGAGAVWVLFLNDNGTVNTQQKINATEGGFTGSLSAGDGFGTAAASLGDLDDDGVNDLAVGAPGDDDGAGAVWALFLNDNGTVKDHQKISATDGGFTGSLSADDGFGAAVASLGDLDGDGVNDLAVGAPGDDADELEAGSVWILFLDTDGMVKNHQKISAARNNFIGILNPNDAFGSALVNLGDVNVQDNITARALAVAAPGDDEGSDDTGAVWVLYLTREGRVIGHQRVSHAFLPDDETSRPSEYVLFGSALGRLSHGDTDGLDDLIVGAPGVVPNQGGQGTVWLLFQRFNALPIVAKTEAVTATGSLPEIDTEIEVAATMEDRDGDVDRVRARLFFRNAGRTDFTNKEMSGDGDTRRARVGSDFVTERGTEYFLSVSDGQGGVARAPAEGIVSIQVEIPGGLRKQQPQPEGDEATAYRLISIPLDLDNKDPGAVLTDDLGPVDNSEWRLFEPVGNDPTGYAEYTSSSGMDMAPGKAFWLIVKEIGKTIGTGPGKTDSTDAPFPIALEPGWNVFGNPFTFDIPVSNLTLDSGEMLDLRCYDDDDPCFPDEDSEQEGSVQWNTVNIDAIMPFEGYAIFVNDATTLFIDPDLSSASQNTATAMAAKASAFLWSIRIRARSGLARDVDNVAVVVPEAAAMWDRLDRAEPPVIGDFVSVYFAHPEWKKATARYSTDARPAPNDGAIWPIEIVTARRDAVHLTFEGLADVPPAYAVWLVDDILGITQNLRQTGTYTVVGGGAADPRPLRLVVGRPGFLEGATEAAQALPERFELFPNFPNPFNPSTTIRYGLPEAAPVSLVVYNMLGQKVATLSGGAEQPAGYHAVVWDGRSDAGTVIASGVYFVRMRAGRFVQTHKMIMVR